VVGEEEEEEGGVVSRKALVNGMAFHEATIVPVAGKAVIEHVSQPSPTWEKLFQQVMCYVTVAEHVLQPSLTWEKLFQQVRCYENSLLH